MLSVCLSVRLSCVTLMYVDHIKWTSSKDDGLAYLVTSLVESTKLINAGPG